ncbi:hypothetical protein XENOCAPTIV_022759, partial [Xenoophorus captivus]
CVALRVFQSDIDSQHCLQVTMVDRAAAERACKDPNPIIDGRKANVNLAYLGAKPRSSQTSKITAESALLHLLMHISNSQGQLVNI